MRRIRTLFSLIVIVYCLVGTAFFAVVLAQEASPSESQLKSQLKSQTTSLTGQIRIQGGGVGRRISLLKNLPEGVPPAPTLRQSRFVKLQLTGNIKRELSRLSGATVELDGKFIKQSDGAQQSLMFLVYGYRLLTVRGGAAPLVGRLIRMGGQLALGEGNGDPLLLKFSPRSTKRLLNRLGAKIWVFGKQTVDGVYRVRRYGLLAAVKHGKSKAIKSIMVPNVLGRKVTNSSVLNNKIQEQHP